MMFYVAYVLLLGMGAAAIGYSLYKVEASPLRRDFLGLLCCGLVWAACLYFVRLPGLAPGQAVYVSSVIFASMELMVVFGLSFAIRLAGRTEMFRRWEFRLFLGNNLALVALSFTPLIAQGVKLMEHGIAPVHGPLVRYLVISNFLSIAYFAILLWLGWRVADRRHRFEIAYFARYFLVSFIFIGICNGILPGFLGVAEASFFGPFGFFYMYYGVIELLSKSDRLYNHKILEDGMRESRAFRSGLNLGDKLPAFLGAFLELIEGPSTRYRKRVDFAGVGPVYVGTGTPDRKRFDSINMQELRGLAAMFAQTHRENNAFREVFGIAERIESEIDRVGVDTMRPGSVRKTELSTALHQRDSLARAAFRLAKDQQVLLQKLAGLLDSLPVDIREDVERLLKRRGELGHELPGNPVDLLIEAAPEPLRMSRDDAVDLLGSGVLEILVEEGRVIPVDGDCYKVAKMEMARYIAQHE